MGIDVCERFNSCDLHDCRIVSVRLLKNEEGDEDISFEMEIIADVKPPCPDDPWRRAKVEWGRAILTFKDCLLMETNVNLLAKRCVSDMIYTSGCNKESELKNKIMQEMVGIGDEKVQKLDISEYVDFTVELVHPAGRISIIAKDYSFERRGNLGGVP